MINEETVDTFAPKEEGPLHSSLLISDGPVIFNSNQSSCQQWEANKKTVRSVRISDTAVEYEAPAPLYLEDFVVLWYSADELAEFRSQAHDIVRHYQTNQMEPPRGLEIYSSNERLQYRWMTLQCIQSAFRKEMSEEKIASISRQCSACSSEIAVLQAVFDYAAVYFVSQEVLDRLPAISSIRSTFPFSMRKRRRSSEGNIPSTTRSKV